VRFSLGKIVSVNIDDVAANGLGGGERQGQVLVFSVQRQVLLVNGALINCVWTRVIYDFAERRS
jgi:hypothetical protein